MSTNKDHTRGKEKYFKYLEGALSDKKRNAFEQEVLRSDFEQEALEGLESIDPEEVREDLQSLSAKINRTPNVWLKIAASVAVLTMAGLGVWYASGRFQMQDEIAMKQKEEVMESAEPEEVTTPIPEQEFDSSAIIPDEVIQDPVATVVETEQQPTPVIEEPVETENIATAAETETTGAGPAAELPVAEETIALADDIADEFDVAGDEPAEADIQGQDMAVTTFEEEEKKAERAIPQAQLTATPTQPGVAGARSAVSPATSPAPAGGIEVFNQYLEANKVYPDSARQFLVEGTVILTLTINESGRLSEVVIKEGLGFGCDQEAVRLVNDWASGWIPAAQNDSTVTGQLDIEIVFP